jgi:hypothetical protein
MALGLLDRATQMKSHASSLFNLDDHRFLKSDRHSDNFFTVCALATVAFDFSMFVIDHPL